MHKFRWQYLYYHAPPDAPGGTPAPGGTTPPAAGGTTPPPAAPGGTAPPAPGGTTPPPAQTQWYETHPDQGVKDLMKAKGYQPDTLATAYYHLNRAHNGAADALIIPGENATPEQLDQFYSKLGRPASPADYKFELPQGQALDPKFETFARDVFHKNGVPAKAATELLKGWQGFSKTIMEEAITQTNTENAAAVEAIKQQHGALFDGLLAKGAEIVQKIGLSDAELAWFDANKGAGPLVKLMTAIGKGLGGENRFVNGGGGNDRAPEAMTPAEAEAEITKLNGDAAFQAKFTNREHAEHALAVAQMERLYAAKNRKAARAA